MSRRSKAALPVLVESFKALDPVIRIEAARALAKVARTTPADVVAVFLKGDLDHRPGIAWALGRAGRILLVRPAAYTGRRRCSRVGRLRDWNAGPRNSVARDGEAGQIRSGGLFRRHGAVEDLRELGVRLGGVLDESAGTHLHDHEPYR